MANLNKVMLIGNLTRDPETRYTPKGTAVGDIALAINRVWMNEQNQKQEETTFVDITLWGRQAELVQQYVQKGHSLYVEGRLQMDTWDDKATGQKRSKLKVVAESIQFMNNAKKEGGEAPSGGSRGGSSRPPQQQQRGPQSPAPADDYGDDDDIPF